MKLDILVIMAHPDDAELSCSGTIISSVKMGLKVGMIDLTKGELGTRGNETIRIKEATFHLYCLSHYQLSYTPNKQQFLGM